MENLLLWIFEMLQITKYPNVGGISRKWISAGWIFVVSQIGTMFITSVILLQ